MPHMSPDPFDLAEPLRPQAFGRGGSDRIAEPVVEPLWDGIRVIAAAHGGRARFWDDGRELTTQDALGQALADATLTTIEGAILDGYVTRHIATDEPLDIAPEPLPTAASLLSCGLVGRRRSGRAQRMQQIAEEEAAQVIADDDTVNLVIVDLLWLDGEWLLDVPLLERKRLLGAILPGGSLVRTGPFVRPPIGTWIGSWRSQGFRGLSFKAANSRYEPGARSSDWATATMPRR